MITDVVIITLYGLENFGNRLQNYALQEMIHCIRLNVSTLSSGTKNNFDDLKSKLKCVAKDIFKKQNGKISFKSYQDFLIDKKNIKRRKNFQDFVDFNMDFIQSVDWNGQVSFFVVGSDQVWNPLLWDSQNPMPEFNSYLLSSVPPQKRIAYAASFGIEELPLEWESKMAEEIKKFRAISVREKAGAQIVKKITGRDVPVVLDPTMLLTAEQWFKIESNQIDRNKKYFLIYFLGPQLREVYTAIYRMADDVGAEVIDLMDYKSKYYVLGPDGFLELIHYAQIVFTDSFHGSVFSILFHRPFIVYQRYLENHPDMGSRLDTLLEKTQLTERVRNREMITEEDFKKADMLIEKEREASIQFLREALS